MLVFKDFIDPVDLRVELIDAKFVVHPRKISSALPIPKVRPKMLTAEKSLLLKMLRKAICR